MNTSKIAYSLTFIANQHLHSIPFSCSLRSALYPLSYLLLSRRISFRLFMLSQRIFRSYSLQSFSTTDMARMDVSSEQPPKRTSPRAAAKTSADFFMVVVSFVVAVPETDQASGLWKILIKVRKDLLLLPAGPGCSLLSFFSRARALLLSCNQ